MEASGLAVEQSPVGGVAAGEVWSLQLLCSEQVSGGGRRVERPTVPIQTVLTVYKK